MAGRRGHSDSRRKGETLAALRTAFDLLNRVLTGADCTVQGLADELGLSTKQVGRYLDVLDDFGVHFERNGNGNRRSPLKVLTARNNPPFNGLFLSRDELLLLYAHLAGVHHAGDAQTRAHLWEKVRHNLGVAPLNGEHLAEALGGFDKAYKSYDGKRALIGDLLAALYANRTCQVTYRRPNGDGPGTYKIEPYELVEFDGGLYLYCRNPYHDAVFPLAVERIEHLALNNETFRRERATEQAIRAMQARAFRILDDGEPLRVKLRFSPDVAFYVAERIWHPTQKLQRHRDGSLTMTFTASGRVEIDRWINGWGQDCTLLCMEAAP